MKTKAAWREMLIGILVAAVAVLLFRLTGIIVSAAASYAIALTAPPGEDIEALFYGHYQLIAAVRHIVGVAALVPLAFVPARPRETLGLRKIRPVSVPVLLLAGLSLAFAVSAALTLLPMPEETAAQYTETMETLTGGQPLLMGLNVVLLAPLLEELAFRALAFRALRRGLPFWVSSLASSLVFGLLHTAVPQMIYAFLLGILFSAIDEKADSALPGFLCHAGFNALSFLFTLLPPYFETWQLVLFGAAAAGVAAGALTLLLGGKRPLLQTKNTSEVSNDASL